MKSFLYNNRYKNLNYKQKIIADWRKGLLWVNACPGSGKTESIAINISNLVIENIKNDRSEDNSKILAFSFTNKAARELKDRVRKMISLEYPKDALSIIDDLSIVTIDKYCLELLSNYDNKYNYFKILSDGEWATYMYSGKMIQKRKMIANLLKTGTDNYESSTIYVLNQLNFLMQNLSKTADNYWDSNSEFYQNKKLIEFYLKTIDGNKVFSYHDYKIILNKLIETNTNLNLQFKKVKYLFVDEVQDINHFQEKIIERILKNTIYSVFVGDDQQAIYSFRGGDIKCVERLFKKYNEEKSILKLDKNYRSSTNIINNLNERFDNSQMIKSNSYKTDHPVYRYKADNEKDFFNFVKNNLKLLIENTTLSNDQIAILVYSNKLAYQLSDYLNKYDLQSVSQKILIDKWFKYIESEQSQGILFQFLDFIVSYDKKTKSNYLINDLYKWLLIFLENAELSFEDRNEITNVSISWFMEFIISQQVLNREVKLLTFAKSVIDKKGIWKLILLNQFFNKVNKNELLIVNKIKILTHHSAKGKEWDVVFNYDKKSNRNKDKKAINYVAFSRAKHILFDISETRFLNNQENDYDQDKILNLSNEFQYKSLAISFATLNNFRNCIDRYKAFNIYLWSTLDSDQKVEGTLIHKALELYNQKLINCHNDSSLIDLKFIKELQNNVYIRKLSGNKSAKKRAGLRKRIQERIPGIMKTYQNWLNENKHIVVKAEYNFNFINNNLINGLDINFTGQIDLLLKNSDNKYTIVDFKILTGHTIEKHQDLDQLKTFEYQIKFYAWILKRHFNYDINKLEILRLIRNENSSEEKIENITNIEVNEEMLNAFEKELQEVCTKISKFNELGLENIKNKRCLKPNCKFKENEKDIYKLLEYFDYK